MKIKLKKLSLLNFKGVRQLTINFVNNSTDIFGDNATGKTTVFDSFLWLLFGKDSTDRKDFEIKTLDENNQPIHRLEHEVSATIEIDGTETIIKRVYREKWVKKRGELESEFNGHETSYYWNEVPMNQQEFQKKISSLVEEGIFKLITNTGYFNSLKWQDRRAVLLQMAGVISDSDILDKIATIKNKTEIGILTNAINQGKSIEEFKREIVSKKKKIKDDLELIPSRIEEAKRALPEEQDYSVIESKITTVKTDIESVESLLLNTSQATKNHQESINKLLNNRQEINRTAMRIEFEIKNEVQGRKQLRDQNILNEKSKLQSKQNDLTRCRTDFNSEQSRKEKLIADQDKLREEWAKVDAEKLEFKEGEFCCPTCKREYEAGDVESKKQELTANFNTDKSKKLSAITQRGTTCGEEITRIDTKLGNLKEQGEKLKDEILIIENNITELETENKRLTDNEAGEIETAITNNEAYQNCLKDIASLTEQIDAPFTPEDNTALLTRKRELNNELDELKVQLSGKDHREKQQARITELETQERNLAQELASLEGTEFCILQFEKAKMNELENRINSRFQIVKFKLFEEQINGGEVPCCDALVNGVPYSDVNTASKIQAGLDIINTLSSHYGVIAPIFIDNRESVVTIPESSSQIINLIVSASDKKLRVA